MFGKLRIKNLVQYPSIYRLLIYNNSFCKFYERNLPSRFLSFPSLYRVIFLQNKWIKWKQCKRAREKSREERERESCSLAHCLVTSFLIASQLHVNWV